MGLQKNFQKFPKISPECTRYNWPESIEKSNLSFTVWPHARSTFWKNMTRNGQNSRPAETDPYVQCTYLHYKRNPLYIVHLLFLLKKTNMDIWDLPNSPFACNRWCSALPLHCIPAGFAWYMTDISDTPAGFACQSIRSNQIDQLVLMRTIFFLAMLSIVLAKRKADYRLSLRLY